MDGWWSKDSSVASQPLQPEFSLHTTCPIVSQVWTLTCSDTAQPSANSAFFLKQHNFRLSLLIFSNTDTTFLLLFLRQAGTWDLLLQHCNAYTQTHLSSSNQLQRNLMELKITVCMHSWGKFWTQKIQRDQKLQLPLFEKPGAKIACQNKSRVLHMSLHKIPPQKWTKHLSHT